jgi:hypothetical protein
MATIHGSYVIQFVILIPYLSNPPMMEIPNGDWILVTGIDLTRNPDKNEVGTDNAGLGPIFGVLI